MADDKIIIHIQDTIFDVNIIDEKFNINVESSGPQGLKGDKGDTGDVNKIYLDTSATTQNLSTVNGNTVNDALNVLDNNISDNKTETDIDIKNLLLNTVLNAFRIAQIGSLTLLQMVNGFTDEYVDESGIDTGASINQIYDVINAYYSNSTLAGEFVSDANTHLLLHLNGTDGDTTSTDDSPSNHTLVFTGLAELDDAQKKFGTTSFKNPGNIGDYIEVQGNLGDFDFGTGDFTLEFFVRFAQIRNQMLLSTVASGGLNWQLYYASNSLQLSAQPGSVNFVQEIWTPNVGQWYHIAVVMNSGVLKFYVDGVAGVNQVETYGTMPNTGVVLRVGGSGGNVALDGWMDEIRISKGVARYTANFTLPTEVTVINDMTLISLPQTATIVPDTVRLIIFEEDIDSVALGTDLKGYVSRDNGTTFDEVTLTEEGTYSPTARILSGSVDVSSQPSGTDMVYKIESLNTKELRLHGAAISYK